MEQEHKRLLAKNEKLKAIGKELDRAYEQSEKEYKYNLKVERYCQEQGITIGQYENNASGRIVTGAITQNQNVTTQTETLSQNEKLQPIPEWSMKGNSKRRPPETRCVSSGLVFL